MDLLGADFFMNPKIMSSSDTKLPDLGEVILDIPTLDESSAPPQRPKLVPSPDDVGPTKSWDGMDNLNAESYMKPLSFDSGPRMSNDAIMKEKYEMLRKFDRLQKMGVPMRKRFTMDSPIDEMKMEIDFIKKEREMDNTIKQFSQWFVTGMSAMEWGSKNVNALRMFGLQLDGLSESAQMNVGEFEEDFEELYELYGDSMKVHPMVRIPMRVCIMVYMVHLTNQMAQKAPIPNIQDILRQNPEIGRQLAGAAMQQQTKQMQSPPIPTPPSNPLSGIMSFMTGTVNPQAGSLPPPTQTTTRVIGPPKKSVAINSGIDMISQQPRREMKGPSGSGIADILKSIRAEAPPPQNASASSGLVSQQMSKAAAAEQPRPKNVGRKAGSTGKNSVVIKL